MKAAMNEEGYEEFIKAVSKYLDKRKKRAGENNIFPNTKITSGALNPGFGQTIN